MTIFWASAHGLFQVKSIISALFSLKIGIIHRKKFEIPTVVKDKKQRGIFRLPRWDLKKSYRGNLSGVPRWKFKITWRKSPGEISKHPVTRRCVKPRWERC